MAAPTRIAPMAAPALRSCASARFISLPSPVLTLGSRNYAGVSKAKMTRELERASRLMDARSHRQMTNSEIQKQVHSDFFKDGGGPLFPGTFISLPMSLVPRSPASFASYQWSRLKQWGQETLSVLNFKLKSMPNWTTRPRWKARRGKIAPTAKAMYQEMLEAFAAGDKATVQRLCTRDFGRKLVNAIERRNPKERVRFEVTKYNNWLFYPRLAAHQVHQVNPYDKVSVLEQAVVAISSTQQVSRYDAVTGETIPGSVKVQDKIEYVVISRQGNSNTFESGPWRIWGTTSATTLEAYFREREVMEKEQAKRAGWKTESKAFRIRETLKSSRIQYLQKIEACATTATQENVKKDFVTSCSLTRSQYDLKVPHSVSAEVPAFHRLRWRGRRLDIANLFHPCSPIPDEPDWLSLRRSHAHSIEVTPTLNTASWVLLQGPESRVVMHATRSLFAKGILARSLDELKRRSSIAWNLDAVKGPSGPRPLYSFDTPDSVTSCILMSDAHIGGSSRSHFEHIKPSSTSTNPHNQLEQHPQPTYARFHGHISTALPTDRPSVERTGYAAFRTPDQGATLFGRSVWDIDPWTFLALRVKSDGRAYHVNLQTETVEPSDLHQHRLFAKRPGHWETVYIRFNDFVRTNYGFVVEPQTELLRQKVKTVGVGLTDRVEGPFELCVERVWATNNTDEGGTVMEVEAEAEVEEGQLKNKKGDTVHW